MKKIAVIIGSTRDVRVGLGVANHIKLLSDKQTNVINNVVEYSIIDLKEINLPMLNEPMPASYGNYKYEHTKQWSALIKQFDAFVLVTAEYNHGYTPAIKNALDYLYNEWNNKKVAFVGYGYSANGAIAVSQLREVTYNIKLKSVYNDVLINLNINCKDNVFISDNNLDIFFKKMLDALEVATLM